MKQQTPGAYYANRQIWAMFYTSITAMYHHPGYQRNPEMEIPPLEELAKLADAMFVEYNRRFPCPSQ